MKTFSILFAFTLFSFSSFSQLQVRNDEFIQIGYEDYRTLSFGIDNSPANNGIYAIEHWNNGLNFWKPYPSYMSGNYILFLRDDNNIGMGTPGSNYFRLDISGRARSWGWYTLSDRRLKTKVESLKGSLEKIMQLQGVSYQLKVNADKYKDLKDVELTDIKKKTIENDIQETESISQIGFLAQDVKSVIPEAVHDEENGLLSVNYNAFMPLLVEAIKEQQEEINELKRALVQLKKTQK